MGLFDKNKGNEGGLMDMVRCDETDYLIWKWRPNRDASVGSSKKENAIRYGSSLRVKPGQAAVFLYQNKGEFDVVFGPFDDIIKSENLPILSSVVGLAYKGGTPFQAEVYFINLAKGLELPFVVPFFRVIPAEPEYKVYDIQVAIKGAMTFEVPADEKVLKYLLEAWGTSDTTLEELNSKMKTQLTQEVKRIVTNAPKDTGIFIMHFNSLIGEMGQYILRNLQDMLAHRFGIFATNIYIEDIRYDEESESYQRLKRITEEQAQIYNLENEKTALMSFEIQRETMKTDADVRNENVRRMADIQMKHTEDMAARMREESQFAQHMQTEQAAKRTELESQSEYLNAHVINKQAEVLKSGMEGLGKMGKMDFGSGGGMNPAGLMTGMMMGGAVGNQAAQMMNQMGQNMSAAMNGAHQGGTTPPPIPNQQQVVFYLVVNGQQFGPCDTSMVGKMLNAGQINTETLGWREGMASWQPINTIPELSILFKQSGPSVPPPIPNLK